MSVTPYSNLPDDLKQRLCRAVDKGINEGNGDAVVFFRADDIAVPSQQFSKLIQLFIKTGMPLCLAVVPCWLTPPRFRELRQLTGTSTSQWCLHQHGWQHKNHEETGKKQEFGSGRAAQAQTTDLARGKERLQTIMAESFYPFFTPPWNRCSGDTMYSLKELGFHGISRSTNAQPAPLTGFPDIYVNTDLHTRKEATAEASLANVLDELTSGISSGRSGIMIHHQRMDTAAFAFLELLLKTISARSVIQPVTFADLC